jgi:hypothetical protein
MVSHVPGYYASEPVRDASGSVVAVAVVKRNLDTDQLGPPGVNDAVAQPVGKLLDVRQVAKLPGMWTASIYRLCGRGELAHHRVGNAIRVDLMEVRAMLQRSRGSHH